MKLKGKVALVTGAGQGIGKSIAFKFAAEGADLALFDINKDTCTETAEESKDLGGMCKVYAVDVASREQVKGACKEVLTAFGRV
ncbi:MAG: SDR family NAD(P)-dependent oxidoreductase, partial [Desulfobacterales bacterium]|nr:SDR family NAD(P)-dependent oxidoreductase [Desulfobacterales bacterium]